MKIALIGYGKVGQCIQQLALQRQHEVTAIIDPYHEQATAKTITKANLKEADVAICFTQPNVALQNILDLASCHIPIVMGTTGWSQHIPIIKEKIEKENLHFIYSSNFSLGVILFFAIIEQTTSIMKQFSEYDVAILEEHHNKKKDAPSGTAITLGNLLLEQLSNKKTLQKDASQAIKKEEIQIGSVRCGSILGKHDVIFDSSFDTIRLSHNAKTRDSFALGAIMAAQWIIDRPGFYNEKDIVASWLSTIQ